MVPPIMRCQPYRSRYGAPYTVSAQVASQVSTIRGSDFWMSGYMHIFQDIKVLYVFFCCFDGRIDHQLRNTCDLGLAMKISPTLQSGRVLGWPMLIERHHIAKNIVTHTEIIYTKIYILHIHTHTYSVLMCMICTFSVICILYMYGQMHASNWSAVVRRNCFVPDDVSSCNIWLSKISVRSDDIISRCLLVTACASHFCRWQADFIRTGLRARSVEKHSNHYS